MSTYKTPINRMKKYFTFLILVLTAMSCGQSSKDSPTLSALKVEKAALLKQIDSLSQELQTIEINISNLDTLKKLMTVTSFQTTTNEFKHYVEIQGTVKATQNVELHSEMGGTVTHILVDEGEQVSKGQLLARLDSSILDSSISQLETQLTLASTTFERQARLWAQNIGSEIQYLQAKAQKESLESSLNSLVAQSQKMKIIAPFSGTIDQIFAKVGELSNPQIPFLRLVNLKKVYIESDVTEAYLKTIQKGTEAILEFPSIGQQITAPITQIGNFINPNNRSFKTRIDVDNTSGELKANLLANIKINDFKAKGIIVPSYLVQKDKNNKVFVFTLEENDGQYRVVKTHINKSLTYNGKTFIEEGLEEGVLIIDKGARMVKANQEVKLAEY